MTGMGWRDIARLTGYTSESHAVMAVQAYLQKAAIARSGEQREAALQTEIDTLNELQQSYYGKALRGDLDAANYVLKVIAQRSRLQRFEEVDGQPTGSRTIVITGNSKEYIGQLKALAEAPVDRVVVEGATRRPQLLTR
jgi:hypothetical protein